MDRAVCASLKAVAVDEDQFSIEVLKGSQSQIAVPAQVGNRHASLVQTLHDRPGCRHLEQRVMFYIQGLRERCLHDVAHTLAAGLRALG